MPRSSFAALIACLLVLSSAACQSQNPAKGEQPTSTAPKTIELPGVDTSKLTAREREQWSASVSELLAPCSDQAVSLAQCISEKRACDACVPAAQFMVGQVTRGKTASVAESAYRARFMPDEVKEIELGTSPGKGASAEDALVTIVEWADFECPFCGMASPLLGTSVKAHSKHVRLVFKHYPLSAHEHAEGAARAAVAAGMQGKFWEMHDKLFENQSTQDDNGLLALAQDIGLDIEKFNAARKTEEVADLVAADRKQADKLGLSGTPTIYINGRFFDLEKFDISEDLDAWIELEVQLRSGKPRAATPAGAVAKGASTAPEASAALEASAAAEASPVPAPTAAAPQSATQPAKANVAQPKLALPAQPSASASPGGK